MSFRYDNANDAQQQLDGCVMLTTDNQVVKLSSEGNWQYHITNLLTADSVTIDVRKAKLSFAPMELGYINSKYGLVYLVRNPIRIWKAGVTWDNTASLRGNRDMGVMTSKCLANAILNIYPSMYEAYCTANKGIRDTAFNKDFAFIAGKFPIIEIEYKSIIIGRVDDDLNFQIDEKYFYLRETLQEIIDEKG